MTIFSVKLCARISRLHFGIQCRLANYGPFRKLKKLFEAIPATIEIEKDINGENMIHLRDCECKNRDDGEEEFVKVSPCK